MKTRTAGFPVSRHPSSFRILFFGIVSACLWAFASSVQTPMAPQIGFIWSNNTVESITSPPTFCIDPQALSIFGRRFSCMKNGSPLEEAKILSQTNTFEYLRANELIAHEFFMSSGNPLRVKECKDAEFEYVPLLPLHWIASKLGVQSHCSYSALIEDVVAYTRHLKSRETLKQPQSMPIRFSVASTFNLRTQMGTGMIYLL